MNNIQNPPSRIGVDLMQEERVFSFIMKNSRENDLIKPHHLLEKVLHVEVQESLLGGLGSASKREFYNGPGDHEGPCALWQRRLPPTTRSGADRYE
ncbi:Hypothetical protein CINCED_3A022213 [Cinara cedri]|uniref:Uncharacterized protein n=1 Tax=Cinara cedri TaxID=506608 RepID=A0A5E4NRN6_9HEMI|nr:Hypothetical protein CINCED_3A022213 [Cinara cedri]